MINLLVYSNKPLSPSWHFYSKLLKSNDKLCFHINEDLDIPDMSSYDVIILFGSGYDVSTIKKLNKDKVIGHLEPRAAQKNNLSKYDFIIVNSIESKDYFSEYCSNIFIYPSYPIIRTKIGGNNGQSKIIIGYHGNKIHLESMTPRITNALHRLNREVGCELWAMYNIKDLGRWSATGLQGLSVKHIQFDYANYSNYIGKVDIGIIPQLIPVSNNKFLLWVLGTKFNRFNERVDNFFLRFKETTNNGRAFIFAQYSIPIVADMTPSSCALLGENECGYLAHSDSGWYNSLLKLAKSKELRLKMGKALNNRYKNLVSDKNLQSSFVNFLNDIKKNK